MPVAPVEGMGGEVGRHHAQFGHAVELVLPDRLGVDHDRSVISQIHGLAGLVQSVQQHLGGRVAVAVHQHGDASADEVGHALVGHGLRDHGIPAVVVPLAVGWHLVGFAQVGRLALRRTIQEQLDATDLHSVLVLAQRDPVRNGKRGIHTHGVQNDVEIDVPGDGRLFDHLVDFPGGAAVLDGGDAVLGVHRKGLAQVRPGCGVAAAVIDVAQRRGGRFLQDAVGLIGAWLTADRAARGIGRLGGDAAQVQRHGVHGGQVTGDVDERDGVVAGDRVQVGSVGVSLLLDERIVVAHADHPLSRRDLPIVDVGADHLLERGHGGDCPYGW